MSGPEPSNPLWHAVQINARRRAERYEESRAAGAAWLLECRDLWDSEDEDAGVYFVSCAHDRDVERRLGELDPASDRLLGIYDLSKPLDPQGPGLTAAEWRSRRGA